MSPWSLQLLEAACRPWLTVTSLISASITSSSLTLTLLTFTPKDAVIALGHLDNARQLPILRSVAESYLEESPFPCKVTYSQALGARTQISLKRGNYSAYHNDQLLNTQSITL